MDVDNKKNKSFYKTMKLRSVVPAEGKQQQGDKSSSSSSTTKTKNVANTSSFSQQQQQQQQQQEQQAKNSKQASHRQQSSRRVRKRLVQVKGMSMDPIPEEARPRQGATRASMIVPLVVIVYCLTTILTSPSGYLARFRRQHRSLLTLTPEHVSQYPFENLLEVDDPRPVTQEKVVGFYWQIPRCGGTTLKHVLGTCLKRVQAARTSADYCDMNTRTLQLCRTKVGTFVNADPSDHGGIQRCQQMKLVESGVADVIVSSRILHAATLFDSNNKGRVFTIFRDPIERAVSTFYYLQNAYWERHYRPELKEMTILDYAALPDTANNWMTRWLTGKNAEPHLSKDDLEFAKELLRRKFLIMLTEDMSSSVRRLMHYMEWDVPDEYWNETKSCLLANTQKESGQNKNKHLMPDEGSPEYEALRAINDLDLELYEYAKKLFVEQWSMVFKNKQNKRIDDLFVEDHADNNEDEKEVDSVVAANRESAHAAALAAAALMEKPPEEASMQNAEATSNLIASALLMNHGGSNKQDNNETDTQEEEGKEEGDETLAPELSDASIKQEAAEIAAASAARQNKLEKWQNLRYMPAPSGGANALNEIIQSKQFHQNHHQQQQGPPSSFSGNQASRLVAAASAGGMIPSSSSRPQLPTMPQRPIVMMQQQQPFPNRNNLSNQPPPQERMIQQQGNGDGRTMLRPPPQQFAMHDQQQEQWMQPQPTRMAQSAPRPLLAPPMSNLRPLPQRRTTLDQQQQAEQGGAFMNNNMVMGRPPIQQQLPPRQLPMQQEQMGQPQQ